MDISWTTKAHGWEGALHKANQDRNNHDLPRGARIEANKAYTKIINQVHDAKLMSLRHRLIRAAEAGDELEMHKIQQQMRDYTQEDRETGLYHD